MPGSAQEFAACYDEFLRLRKYDEAENALFSMIRIAFYGGWVAAGGDADVSYNLYHLFHKDLSDLPDPLLTDFTATVD